MVPSVTPEEARNLFHESRRQGVAVVLVTVKVLHPPPLQRCAPLSVLPSSPAEMAPLRLQEHAEFYAQMMVRSGMRSAIEPDSA